MTARNGCRIGNIRFKSGGSMRLLQKPEPVHKCTIHSAITEWFDGVKSEIEEPVGFVTIAWSRDNTYTIHDFFSEDSCVSRSMGPSFVSECMRRRNSLVDNDS